MKTNWRHLKWVVSVAMVALLLSVTTIAAQTFPKNPMDWVMAKRLTVATISTLTGNVTTGADLTVGDDIAVTGDLVLTPATPISVTMNATITPLGSYQPLTSAGTVNTASITVGAAGTVLTLVNSANTSIVFTDTGTLKLTGNITLGQYDTLTLVSDGTNWVMRSTANN